MALSLGLLIIMTMFVFQALSVNLRLDVQEPEERECWGTFVGFGYSGTLERHYQHMRKKYTGCTYLHGNLEITNLMDPKIKYDLSFLKDIRYVTGSVLIGLLTEVEEIPLLNLEVIRGNSTNYVQGNAYSLVVVLTTRNKENATGLKRLYLPKLKEITEGKVLFTGNPSLGYVNTIDWEPIFRGQLDNVHFFKDAFNESVASINDTTVCEHGSRWGDEPSLCQPVSDYIVCHEDCNGRCFGPEKDKCCHDTCAIGCYGPDEGNCTMCKDYIYDNYCVGFCPAKSYPKSQNCIKYD